MVFRVEVRQGVFPSQMKTAVAQGSCLSCCCCRWTRFPLTLTECFAVGSTSMELFWANIDSSIGICSQGNKLKYGMGKNKQSHKENPDPAGQSLPCSQSNTGQVQTKVTAQGKLWPREESRSGCCPLSPSLTHTVDTDGSDLPFLRFLPLLLCRICSSSLTLITHNKGWASEFLQQRLPSGVAALKVAKGFWEQHPTMSSTIYPLRLQVHIICSTCRTTKTAKVSLYPPQSAQGQRRTQLKTKPWGCVGVGGHSLL